MELPVVWVVIFGVLMLFIQYVIIETAVRRGLDASRTHELLEEILENQKNKENK